MDNEILPAVQRMKDDREEYLKYQKYERDIEVLRKKQYAFVYDRAQVSLPFHTIMTYCNALTFFLKIGIFIEIMWDLSETIANVYRRNC